MVGQGLHAKLLALSTVGFNRLVGIIGVPHKELVMLRKERRRKKNRMYQEHARARLSTERPQARLLLGNFEVFSFFYCIFFV